jgi:hypothetical protein
VILGAFALTVAPAWARGQTVMMSDLQDRLVDPKIPFTINE